MKETKDYDKFTLLDYNREINKTQVKKIKESIQKFGYISSNPIIVDKDFNIIDGQHRYEACRELDLPIIYDIADQGEEIIITLNTLQKKWSLMDYVTYYAKKKGDANYLRLEKLCKRYNLKPNTILILLNGSSDGHIGRIVKNGKFKFSHDEEIVVENNLRLSTAVCNNLKQKMSIRFLEALQQLSRLANFKWTIMLNKSEKYPTLAYNCITRDDYLTMIKSIYNYQARNITQKI